MITIDFLEMCAHYECVHNEVRLKTHFDIHLPGELARRDVWPGYQSTFIRTSPFRKNDTQHSACRTLPLPAPSSDSAHLTEVACAIVRRLYRPGHNYAMAGVMLMNLTHNSTEQISFLRQWRT